MRIDKRSHQRGPAGHHESASADSGVDKVFANAAKEHFDNDNREQAAEDGHPNGGRHRDIVGEQQAGNNSGAVADGRLTSDCAAVQVFAKHAGDNASAGNDERTRTEGIERHRERGQKGDDHIEHHTSGILIRFNMGRGGDDYFT